MRPIYVDLMLYSEWMRTPKDWSINRNLQNVINTYSSIFTLSSITYIDSFNITFRPIRLIFSSKTAFSAPINWWPSHQQNSIFLMLRFHNNLILTCHEYKRVKFRVPQQVPSTKSVSAYWCDFSLCYSLYGYGYDRIFYIYFCCVVILNWGAKRLLTNKDIIWRVFRCLCMVISHLVWKVIIIYLWSIYINHQRESKDLYSKRLKKYTKIHTRETRGDFFDQNNKA